MLFSTFLLTSNFPPLTLPPHFTGLGTNEGFLPVVVNVYLTYIYVSDSLFWVSTTVQKDGLIDILTTMVNNPTLSDHPISYLLLMSHQNMYKTILWIICGCLYSDPKWLFHPDFCLNPQSSIYHNSVLLSLSLLLSLTLDPMKWQPSSPFTLSRSVPLTLPRRFSSFSCFFYHRSSGSLLLLNSSSLSIPNDYPVH